MPAAEFHEPHQRQRGDRLARPRFAHDADRLARADLEAHVLDADDRAVLRLELHPEVLETGDGLVEHD
jgi:hypothetical protein